MQMLIDDYQIITYFHLQESSEDSFEVEDVRQRRRLIQQLLRGQRRTTTVTSTSVSPFSKAVFSFSCHLRG